MPTYYAGANAILRKKVKNDICYEAFRKNFAQHKGFLEIFDLVFKKYTAPF